MSKYPEQKVIVDDSSNVGSITQIVRFGIPTLLVVSVVAIAFVMVSGYDLRTLFKETRLEEKPTIVKSTTVATTGVWDFKNCTIPVASYFKLTYDEYRDYLGCATETVYTIPLIAEQIFQGGHLFWREDKNELYVIYDRLPDNTELFSGSWLKSPPEWQWDGSYRVS